MPKPLSIEDENRAVERFCAEWSTTAVARDRAGLRESGLLALSIPVELGGSDLAGAAVLGQRCQPAGHARASSIRPPGFA